MVEFSEQPPPPGANLLPPTSYSANPNPSFSFQHISSTNTEHTGYPVSPFCQNSNPHFQTTSPHVPPHDFSPFGQGVATQYYCSLPNNLRTQPCNLWNSDLNQTGISMANSFSQSGPVNVVKPYNPNGVDPTGALNSICPGEVDLRSVVQVAVDKGIIEQKGDSAEFKYSSLCARDSSDIESAAQVAVLREQEITTQQVINNQRLTKVKNGTVEDGHDILSGRHDPNSLKEHLLKMTSEHRAELSNKRGKFVHQENGGFLVKR